MNQVEPDPANGAPRAPGRPREPETDARILDAAFRLMAQGGYVRMSMDAVAAEAGVTKPTIYRRWPSKIELAMAALRAYCDASRPPVVGDTRADLIAELEHFRRALSRPYGMSLYGTVLAEEHETPGLLAAFRESLVVPRRRALRAILEAAQTRGELRPDAEIALAVNMMVGAFYAQYVAGVSLAADWSATLVETLLCGLASESLRCSAGLAEQSHADPQHP
jgi:AcrR family transcriptional regulator